MSTIAAEQTKPKWEYMELSRKTETYLVNDLNELGEAGWELVSITYHKDLKGVAESWSWTAFLKRTYSGQSPAARVAAATAAKAAARPSASRKMEEAESADIFDVRDSD
jgi:hypothetical protein